MNGVHDRPIRKFNPGTLQSDDEVVRQFVVRHRELDLVLDVLRGNLASPSCQHLLIVAPRGRGKTMLLARVGTELRTNAALTGRLFPVRFMEESQEVFTMADFWLETLFYLAQACAQAGDAEHSRDLLATHGDLTARWNDGATEDRAHAAVLEAAERLGRRLVLMVENLQALSNAVDDDFGWKLRKTLQAEPQVVLLATATSRFKGLDDAAQPFFEQFRIVDLEPLDTDECRDLWHMVSGDTGGRREIEPLRILTGGSPRLLTIVAGLARHASLRRLLEDLVTLIDNHTEYFRGHLDVLAKTERRVYLAVIDLWQPSSTAEIAARARMDVRSVSALLGRLVDRGAVLVERTGRKRRYAVAERLYSIYYKLRRERGEAAIVRHLIRFMTMFYSDDELAALAANDLGKTRLGIGAVPDLQLEVANALVNKGVAHGKHGETEAELSAYDAVVERFGDSDAPDLQVRVATAMLYQGIARGQRGETEAELSVYDAVVERFGDSDAPDLQVRVATALLYQGITHGQHGEAEAELWAYDAVVGRFGDSAAPDLQMAVAKALLNMGITHGQRGEAEAELAVYDSMVERFGDSSVPDLRVQVVKALFNKGITHGQRGEMDEALAAYGAVVRRLSDNAAPALQVEVAKALFNKGVTHGQRGDTEAELSAYDMLVERFGDSAAPALQVVVAKARVNKGITYGQRGETDAGLRAYDAVVEHFGDGAASDLQVQVAKALVNKGTTHGQRGETDAELSAYDTVVERFGDGAASDLQVEVAQALFNKGITHGQRGETDAELSAYDAIVARFGNSVASDLQVQVARALVNKGITHGQRGEMDAELSTYDTVVERFGNSDESDLQVQVAKALGNKGITQGQRGDTDAELTAYDAIVERFGDSVAPDLRVLVAQALFNKGITQGQRGDTDARLTTFGAIVERFGDCATPNLQVVVARALVAKGITHGQRGETEAELTTHATVVGRFGASDRVDLQRTVAAALVATGDRLVRIGRLEEALQTIDDLQRRCGAFTDDAQVAFELWRAEWVRAHALLAQGEHRAALNAWRSICAALVDDVRMLREMLARVPVLIRAGAAARDVADVLAADGKIADAVAPLVVALRQLAGQSVRAPAEVLEVAAHVRERIEAAVTARQSPRPASDPRDSPGLAASDAGE